MADSEEDVIQVIEKSNEVEIIKKQREELDLKKAMIAEKRRELEKSKFDLHLEQQKLIVAEDKVILVTRCLEINFRQESRRKNWRRNNRETKN